MERFDRLELGMRDDTSIAPTALRFFTVGNLVIYKPETAVGWYEGEVVKVSQRMRFSESHSEYIAYLVWPHRDDYLSDDEAFTVLDDGHGNSAFALYLKQMLVNCDTEVRLVAHSDTIKTGKRSRSTIGDITSEMMTRLLDIPGFLIDDESSDDIVARAQEEYVDYLVSQQLGKDEADDDTSRLEAQRMKELGNQYFQQKDLTSAIR